MKGVSALALVRSEHRGHVLPILPISVQEALAAPPWVVFLHAAAVWAVVLLGIWAIPSLTLTAKAEGADRALSTLHAIVATMAGFYILCAVPADCKRVSDETAIAYGFVSMTAAYLAVDFCSMLIVDVFKGWRDVDKGMIVHHVILLVLYASMVSGELVNPHLYLGGSLLAMEASTPVLNLIWLLRFIGKRESRMYAISGISLLVVFCGCRIIMVPAVCWHWYVDVGCKNESIGLILFIATFYCINVFWLSKLIAGASSHSMLSHACGLTVQPPVQASSDTSEQPDDEHRISEAPQHVADNGGTADTPDAKSEIEVSPEDCRDE